jgi:hypothetical protein
MASYIARRKFLATLSGAAAWSLTARAQGGKAADDRFLGRGRHGLGSVDGCFCCATA